MSVVVTLMFRTATDLGDPGVDDVYGHGLVNISAAVSVQNLLQMPGTGSARVIGTRARLSGALRGLESELEGVAAVVTTSVPGVRYTQPFSGFIEKEETLSPARGYAAADMLRPSEEFEMLEGVSVFLSPRTGEFVKGAIDGEWGRLEYQMCPGCETSVWDAGVETYARPSFINDGEAVSYRFPLSDHLALYAASGLDEDAQHGTYRQYGVQWRGDAADRRLAWGVDLSRIDEKEGLLGGEFTGAFAVGDSRTWQSRWSAQLNPLANWNFAAVYELGRIDSDGSLGDSIITDISAAWFDAWKVKMEGRDLFRPNDVLRLHLEQQMTVQSGTVGINHSVFDDRGGYKLLHTRAGLQADEIYIGRLGYRYSPGDNIDAAFGLEYADTSDDHEAAASFALRWIF